MKPTLFVSGANGKLGRSVVEQLLARGYDGKIIAGTRNPEAISVTGIEVRKADFTDPAGLTRALEGVDRVLIISATGPERVAGHINAITASKAAGVERLVYTSAPNPTIDSPLPLTTDHRLTEEAIASSGVPYTILRNMWYAENLLLDLPPVLASGKWYSASGTGRQAHVTRRDAARAAAGALLADTGASRTLTVTGPDLLTIPQIAAIASAVTGRPLEVVQITDEEFRARAFAAGIPQDAVDGFFAPFERNTREGRVDIVSDAVKQLWGEKPQGVRAFLEANRAALSG